MSHRGAISLDLQQQLQRQVRSLTVEKLKKILRNAGMTVTGTKATLVERITTELNHQSQLHDTERFTRLRHLIQNPDNPPGNVSPAGFSTSSASPGGSLYGSSHSNGNLTNSYGTSTLRPTPEYTCLSFKSSPFYTIQEQVISRRQLDPREHSRDAMDFSFRLRTDVLEKMRRDHRMKVLLYSGVDDSPRPVTEVAFPSNFELKVNGTEVRANFKGLKNRPGTTRPVDITPFVSHSPSVETQVWLTWAVTSRKYHLTLYFVRQHDAVELVQKLKEASRIQKTSVLKEINAWADDSDIVATSFKMSLKCPLSTMRIETPCRSRVCKHNQCFDALSFLQLQEQAPQWSCPVCSKNVPFESLQIDEYVNDILDKTPRSAEQVTVEPDGRWALSGDDVELSYLSQKEVKKEETTSSDEIEIVDETTSSLTGSLSTSTVNLASKTNQTLSDSFGSASVLPATSKRTASEVIDLTADTDEDDDQPVRPPAKRQMTGSAQSIDWGNAAYRPSHETGDRHERFQFHLHSKSPQLPGSRFG